MQSSKLIIAAKLAPFPDSKTLQPIPESIQPNVSGNVNHTSSNVISQPTETTDTSNATATAQIPKNSSHIILWINIVFIILLIAVIAVIARKR